MLRLIERGCNGTVTNGDIKVTWLKGGNTHLDGGAMFGVVPKVLWSRKYKHNDTNHIYLRTIRYFCKRKTEICSLIQE